MLAVSISVPSKGKIINAAVADHVPVAELIPHLVDPEPGELWELQRAIGVVAPEHSLAEAGIRPGEAMTLACRRPAEPPAPPVEAGEELAGDVGTNWAAWIIAGLVALLGFRSAPVWHPLEHHGPEHWGFGAEGVDLAVLIPLIVTMLAALSMAALGLYDHRFLPLAAALGFAVGMNVNVLCGVVAALLLVWRPGVVRIGLLATALLAAVNFYPSITAVTALVLLTYSGQLALGITKVVVPRVPAAGIFHDPAPPVVASAARDAIKVHSALVAAACAWLVASVMQLVPGWPRVLGWPGASSTPDVWTIALMLCLALAAVSARSTRPFHANCLAVTTGVIVVWLGSHVSWGIIALVLLGLPLVRVNSPQLGRAIDTIEAIAFCVAVPLALHATGLFNWIRGLG